MLGELRDPTPVKICLSAQHLTFTRHHEDLDAMESAVDARGKPGQVIRQPRVRYLDF